MFHVAFTFFHSIRSSVVWISIVISVADETSYHCTYHPAESPSSTSQKPGSARTCANWTVKSKNSWLWCPRAGFGWWGILSSMEGCPICHSSEICSLELILVSTCSYDFHIKSAVWSTFLHLKSMSYYCNRGLFGPLNKALGRIQDVQNPVASTSPQPETSAPDSGRVRDVHQTDKTDFLG